MTRGEPLSAPAARWILALTVLAALAGLVFVQVVRRGTGDEVDPAQQPSSSRPGSGVQGARPDTDEPEETRPPVDRRRLAEALRRLRQGAGAPMPSDLPKGAEDGGRGPRGGASPGDPGAPLEERVGAGDSRRDEDDVQWPVDREGIRGAIQARIAEIKECYDGWLTEEPGLAGRIVVSFAIEAGDEGAARIREAEIHGSEVEHSGLERCILVMVESLQFEPPTGGRVVVRYPFAFSPRPATAASAPSE